MLTRRDYGIGAIVVVFATTVQTLISQPVLTLELQEQGPQSVISWPSTLNIPDQGDIFPTYTIERSSDLLHWEPVSGKIKGLPERPDPMLEVIFNRSDALSFFRLTADLTSSDDTALGNGGAEVFGFNRQFESELSRIGQLSLEAFSNSVPQPAYLSGISWDPTTAAFWTEFNADLEVGNAELPAESPDRRLTDFRLNLAELYMFTENGFVVSERLGSYSFADIYYRIFTDDLPVFVTTDSI